jgi:PIN domain nuclease of toxin-antitoxin system
MAYLIDTHAFLWFVFDDPRLSARAEAVLADAGSVVISAVTLWEIAVKLSIDKLRLGMPYPEFLDLSVTSREVEVLGVELPHLVEYADLPMHHRDPFDRLLIAQSRAERLTVVTADPRFRDYDVDIAW